uniref:Zasp-like motif domain-containing protein n=1 Tax=Anopheles atroparvus TaxID=41427 RepID=A0AAG5D8T0_ANOAO
MAAMQRRLVHKQFNSPINLYSQKNIQETLDRELKLLSNGAVGIDFDDPSTTKPPSLAKSAVLAALEEEEREKSRGTGLKRVAWPPPAEGSEYEVHPSQQQHAVGQQIPVQQQYQPPQHQQPQQQYHQTAPHQQQQQQPHPTYQQTNFQQQHPHQPVERIIPIQRPEDQQHYQQPLAPQYQNPLQQQPYQPQPTEAFQPLTSQQPLYQTTVQPQQQQQQLPPTLVTTLRKEPPMSQEPAPVYQTQPVAAIYQGGSNMRGDQKWPPEEYKRQSEVDNEERRKLAQQPAFRPRRQQKDYGAFFAKNALNNTYPGYRAPPGTQHHG